jgi:sensor histidine kinase regulating citrate/malate metabolism
MNHYTEHLVREELGLGNLIENALRALQQTEEKEEDSDVTIEDYDSTEELSDQDFINFNDEVEAQQKKDAEIMAELMDGGE